MCISWTFNTDFKIKACSKIAFSKEIEVHGTSSTTFTHLCIYSLHIDIILLAFLSLNDNNKKAEFTISG